MTAKLKPIRLSGA